MTFLVHNFRFVQESTHIHIVHENYLVPCPTPKNTAVKIRPCQNHEKKTTTATTKNVMAPTPNKKQNKKGGLVGWWDGAGILPVPRRPTNFANNRTRVNCQRPECLVFFGHFTHVYHLSLLLHSL